MVSNQPKQYQITDIDGKPKPTTINPDNQDGNGRLNVCCPCMECLDACIKQEESGGEGSPVLLPDNNTNPTGVSKPDSKHTGCDSTATDCGRCDTDGDGKPNPVRVRPGGMFDSDCDGVPDCLPGSPCDRHCDCGPYQIDWNGYVKDVCDVNICQYDPSCCEVCNPGFGSALCQPCGNNAACCEEKDRRSKKLMDCWRRRYTRNPCGMGQLPPCNCPGGGSRGGSGTIPHNDNGHMCFTCQDLARMHNGGPCGHRVSGTTDYWKKISGCMREKCGFSANGNSESCSDDLLDVVKMISNDKSGIPVTDSEKRRQKLWEKQRNRKSSR